MPEFDRSSYELGALDETDLTAEPLDLLQLWLAAARSAGVKEPSAFCLSTSGDTGQPNGRIVLCRGVDASGIVFYTNYESTKGQELAANPRAAATFWWGDLERQVRLQGVISRVSEGESDAYFASRPVASQIASTVSPQSRIIANREELEQAIAEQEPGPRPAHWGGFRLIPDQVEFWQGRPARVHDRLRYRWVNETWIIERLAP